MSISIIPTWTQLSASGIYLVSKICVRTSTYWPRHIHACMSNFIFMRFYWSWRTLSHASQSPSLFIISRSNCALCDTNLDYGISILWGRALICTSTWRVLCVISNRTPGHTGSIYSLLPWYPLRISICIIGSYRATWDTSPCMRVSKIVRDWRTS